MNKWKLEIRNLKIMLYNNKKLKLNRFLNLQLIWEWQKLLASFSQAKKLHVSQIDEIDCYKATNVMQWMFFALNINEKIYHFL